MTKYQRYRNERERRSPADQIGQAGFVVPPRNDVKVLLWGHPPSLFVTLALP